MRGETQYSKKTVTAAQAGDAIIETLKKYGDAGSEAVKKAVKKTAKAGAKELNSSAAATIHGRRHKYEKSWKTKVSEGATNIEATLYSNQPGLAHLLEFGHEIKYLGGNIHAGSGKAKAYPHIEKVEKELSEELVANIEKEVEKI